MLNLSRIRVFFEVARQGSFAAAAAQLDYTPSAVSHQIAMLERELGTRLINRSVRPWTLTAAGAELYARSEAALAELAAAESEIATLSRTASERVRLSSVISGLRSVVPAATAAFKVEHPDVELVLAEAQPRQILQDLRTGDVEVGIVVTAGGEPPSLPASLTAITLVAQALIVVLPLDHRLARAPHVTLRQLRGEPWLLPARRRVAEFRDEVDELFAAAGYLPRVALELDDDVAAQALIAAGVGIALAPALAAPHPHPGITAIPLRPRRSRVLHAIAPAGRRAAPVETLLRRLEAVAAGLAGPRG